MSIEALEDIDAQIEEVESHECLEESIFVTVRVISNGTTTYYRQCSDCGKTHGAVKKPANDSMLQIFDSNIYDRRRKALAQMKEIRTQMGRAIEKDDWWSGYTEYLKSESWRIKRKLVMRRAGGFCEGCGINPADQVHHTSYDHVGHQDKEGEFLFELLAVCTSCHSRIHKKKV